MAAEPADITDKTLKRPDQRSDEAQAYRAWYRTPRWRALRADQLKRQPLCVMCKARGAAVEATVCNHAERHNGNEYKFWHGPFNSLCGDCHDVDQQRIEKGGRARPALDDDGWPID